MFKEKKIKTVELNYHKLFVLVSEQCDQMVTLTSHYMHLDTSQIIIYS